MIYFNWFLFGILFGLGLALSVLLWDWARVGAVRLRRLLNLKYRIDF